MPDQVADALRTIRLMPRAMSWVAALCALATLAAVVAARAPLGLDYAADLSRVDSARPQIDALADLDLQRFTDEQSPLGPVSLVLRAPFAAAAGESDQLGRYRLGAFACLLALALAAFALALTVRRRAALWHAGLVAAVVMFSPPVHQALVWGHPEELLTTALVVAATLLACARRPVAAGVVAGLAVASKPWALLAVAPILLLAAARASGKDARRTGLQAAAAALSVSVVLIAPMALANRDSFRRAVDKANATAAVKPMDVWWLTSSHHVVVTDGVREQRVRHPHLSPAVLDGIRTAIVLAALAVAIAAALRGRMTAERVALTLALIFLLRCVLDPGDHVYYHLPFITALAAWEGLRARPPLLALGTSVLLSGQVLRLLDSDLDAIGIVYLLWSIPLAGWLAWSLLRRPSARVA
jgi:hypothetical protein